MSRSILVLTLVVASSVHAQNAPTYMQLGQVVHGFGGGAVALLDLSLQTTTPLQIVPGNLGCNAFTWDPLSPDDLVAWASDGHVYRATVTAGGVSVVQFTQQPLPGTSGVLQMSWDANGDLITVGSALNSQIVRVDRTTGVATPVLSWPFPTAPRCGRVDPSTGDYYIGTDNAIYQVSGVQSGTPSVNMIYSAPGIVADMTLDPLQPQYILFIQSGHIRRVDKNTGVSETLHSPPPFFDGIRTDHQGGFIAIDQRDVYQIDNPAVIPTGGITPMLLGSNASVGCCTNTDNVVIGETLNPFRLQVTTQPGGGAQIDVLNVPVGVSQSWMFVSKTTYLPAGGGPFLGILPDAWTFAVMSAFAVPQPGNFVHSLGPPPSSVTLPAGTFAPFIGETWDAVTAAIGPGGAYWGRTNVERITWQ